MILNQVLLLLQLTLHPEQLAALPGSLFFSSLAQPQTDLVKPQLAQTHNFDSLTTTITITWMAWQWWTAR